MTRIVDHLQIGPFSTAYHRALVSDKFTTALERFLQLKLAPQLNEAIHNTNGTVKATFDHKRFCGPSSLIRNIFTLELHLTSDTGPSELKADVIFDPEELSFATRKGHDFFFYLWTPQRKRQREEENARIQRFVSDIKRNRTAPMMCPICGGPVRHLDRDDLFDVACTDNRCFKYNYHKDENGRLAHGHFFRRHPQERAEQ